jgi:Leucine-rich repeat (LRR) protein
MKTTIRVIFIIHLFLLSFVYSHSQTISNSISNEELVNYEKQARQLVGFMEFAFNTLGSDKSEYKDKHTIIEQSYLKFFKNDKVQIEDDLVEKRDVVTNKDVQAYLKDIDFFFKDVTFKYTIEEITQEINDAGQIFFKIKASRNLKGKTLENKDINDNRPRFIEINLDQSTHDLKIVSVYTTKSSEEQELITWWNNLDRAWRHFLAGEAKVNDSVFLKDIIVIHNDYIVKEVIYANYSDSLVDTDTITVNESRILPEVRKILRKDEIDLSGVVGIYDLKPLYAFSGLKHLNISNAKVPDLDPIRNLSKLETLIASKSLINSIEPIRYIPQMRTLDLSSTFVSDISPIESFSSLEKLNISGTKVVDLSVIAKLTNLTDLNISNLTLNQSGIQPISNLLSLQILDLSRLPIDTLTAVGELVNLKRLNIDFTSVRSLNGLDILNSLELISLDNTPVSSLDPLNSLPNLKLIYCDKTNIDSKKALAFMNSRSEVKVIYESQELMVWWLKLSDDWKEIFRSKIELSTPPTREQLHELTFIKSLDISDNVLIKDISPLTELTSLQELNIEGTSVNELSHLSETFTLQSLNLRRTRIADLTPLKGLTNLISIDFSHSAVISIKPLVQLNNLRTIGMDSTNVSDTEYLGHMKHLETVFADGVTSLPLQVDAIIDSIPNVLIVFQTKNLTDWWNGLSDAWKGIFAAYEPINEKPNRIQLHKITSLKDIDINNKKEITNIAPLSTIKWLESLNASNLQLTDLSPLKQMSKLRIVDISNTPVSDISALRNHNKLEELNCANSPVNDLSPLSWHLSLKRLNISGTQVTKLDQLETCSGLEELICFNTRISNIKPLDKLNKIKLLRAYNTKLSEKKIYKFKELHPQAEVVFY